MNDEGYHGSSPEERLEGLERKVAEMEALVKGLTDEMLDMKAVVMKLKKDQRPAPVIQAVAPPAPSRNKPPRLDDDSGHETAPVRQNQPQKEKVTLKMQPDGTLAPVRDIGEDIIIASARDARSRGKDGSDRSRSDLIIAEDTEQTEQK
jgi:hypothetical protein